MLELNRTTSTAPVKPAADNDAEIAALFAEHPVEMRDFSKILNEFAPETLPEAARGKKLCEIAHEFTAFLKANMERFTWSEIVKEFATTKRLEAAFEAAVRRDRLERKAKRQQRTSRPQLLT